MKKVSILLADHIGKRPIFRITEDKESYFLADITKIKSIFKWLKNNNISDKEMLKTFNCGVGFCLIVNKKNVKKIKKYFSKNYKPYEIGFISNNKTKINIYNKIKW